MAAVSDDRWTCPRCERTTIVSGSPADVRAALAAVRDRHGTGHTAGDHTLARLGLPEHAPQQPTGRRRRRAT